MNKNVLYSITAGIALYIIIIYLAMIQRDLTGSQLLLILVTPLLIGILSGEVKKGLLLGFLIPLVMLLLEAIILLPGAFSNPNVALAVLLISVLPFAAISAGLGAVGGLIGRHIFRKKPDTVKESGSSS